MLKKYLGKLLTILICLSIISTSSVGFAYAQDPVTEPTNEIEPQEELLDDEIPNLDEGQLDGLGIAPLNELDDEDNDGISPYVTNLYPSKENTTARYNDPKRDRGFNVDINGNYLIENKEDLAHLSASMFYGLATDSFKNKKFKQTADINLSDYEWIPIGVGNSTSTNIYEGNVVAFVDDFQGFYDGGNFNVSNMHINIPEYYKVRITKQNAAKPASSTALCVGLFGKVTTGGAIDSEPRLKNINVIDSEITFGSGNDYKSVAYGYVMVGGIVGRLEAAIDNCSLIDSVIDGSQITATHTNAATTRIGGIAGDVITVNANITNCKVVHNNIVYKNYAVATTTGHARAIVGGIVGTIRKVWDTTGETRINNNYVIGNTIKLVQAQPTEAATLLGGFIDLIVGVYSPNRGGTQENRMSIFKESSQGSFYTTKDTNNYNYIFQNDISKTVLEGIDEINIISTDYDIKVGFNRIDAISLKAGVEKDFDSTGALKSDKHLASVIYSHQRENIIPSASNDCFNFKLNELDFKLLNIGTNVEIPVSMDIQTISLVYNHACTDNTYPIHTTGMQIIPIDPKLLLTNEDDAYVATIDHSSIFYTESDIIPYIENDTTYPQYHWHHTSETEANNWDITTNTNVLTREILGDKKVLENSGDILSCNLVFYHDGYKALLSTDTPILHKGKSVYVDQTNGDDTNNGTHANPFKTLDKAIKTLPSDGDVESNVIHIIGEYKTDPVSSNQIYGNRTEPSNSSQTSSQVLFAELLQGSKAPNDTMSYKYLVNQSHKNFTIAGVDSSSKLTIQNKIIQEANKTIWTSDENGKAVEKTPAELGVTLRPAQTKSVVQMGDLRFDNLEILVENGNDPFQWYCNGYDLYITDSVRIDSTGRIGKDKGIGVMSVLGDRNYLYWSIYGSTLGTLPMVATLGCVDGEYGIVDNSIQTIKIESGEFSRVMGGGRIGDNQRNFYKYYDKELHGWVYPYNEKYIYTSTTNNLPLNNTNNYTAVQDVKEVNKKYLHPVDIYVTKNARVGLVVGGQTEDICYNISNLYIDAKVATVVGGSIGNNMKLYSGTSFINGVKETGNVVKKVVSQFGGDFKGNTNITIYENAECNYVTGGSLGRALYAADNAQCAVRGEEINITILGGIIHESIYGAGAGGTAGTYKYNNSYDESQVISNLDLIDVVYPTNVTINIRGGKIEGNVYGGGDGYFEFAEYTNKHAGLLAGSTTIDITGGTIEGNVYGGGKGVDYDTAVKIVHIETIRGNNDIAHVFGNTYVRIRAGKIKGSVYGGGEGVEYYLNASGNKDLSNGQIGQVTGFTLVVLGDFDESKELEYVKNSFEIGGNVFGGGKRGYVTSGSKINATGDYKLPGNAAVVMAGGTIDKSVYGGGENANIITPAASGIEAIAKKYHDLGSLVYIGGGEVKQAVFGGCKQANVMGDAKVVIVGGTIVGDVFGGNDISGKTLNSFVYVTSRNKFTELESGVFGGGYGIDTSVEGQTIVRIGDRTLNNKDANSVLNFKDYIGLESDVFEKIYSDAKNKYLDRDEKEIEIWEYINYLSYDMYRYGVNTIEDKAVEDAGELLADFAKYDGNKIIISNRIYGGGMLGRVKDAAVIMYGGTLVKNQYNWRTQTTSGYQYVGAGNGNYIQVGDNIYEYKEGGDYRKDQLYIDYTAIFGGGFGLDIANVFSSYEGLYPANVEKTKVIIADEYGTHKTATNDNTIDRLNQDDAYIFGGGQLATVGLRNDLIEKILYGTESEKISAQNNVEKTLSSLINNDSTTTVIVKDKAHPTNNIYGGGQGRENADFAKVYGSTFVETSEYAHVTKHEIYDADKDGISIFGGGQNAGIEGTTEVIISGHSIVDRVYGGNQTSGVITGATYDNHRKTNTKADYSTNVYIVEKASVNEAFGGGYEADLPGNTFVYVNGDSVGSWKGTGISGDPHEFDSPLYTYYKAINKLIQTTPGLENKSLETKDIFEMIPILASYGVYGYKASEKLNNTDLQNAIKISDPAVKQFVINTMINNEALQGVVNPALNRDTDGTAHAPTANVYDLYGGGYISNVGDTTVIIRGGAVFNAYGAGAGRNSSSNHNAKGANVNNSRVAVLPGSTIENVYGGANINGTAVTTGLIVGYIPDYVQLGTKLKNHLGKVLTDKQSISFNVVDNIASNITEGKTIAGKTFTEATIVHTVNDKQVTINKATVVVDANNIVTSCKDINGNNITNIVSIKTCDENETYIGTERIHVYGDVFGAGYGINTKVIGNETNGSGTTVLVNMPVVKETIASSFDDREKFFYNNKLIDFAGDTDTRELDLTKVDGELKVNDSKLFNLEFSDSTLIINNQNPITAKVIIDASGNISTDPSITINNDDKVLITTRKIGDAEHQKVQDILYGKDILTHGTTRTSPKGDEKPDMIVLEIPAVDSKGAQGHVDQYVIWRDAHSEYNSNRIDGSVYGGGNLGQVGASDKPAMTKVEIIDGHIVGSIFGGGSGKTNGVRENSMGAVYGFCSTSIDNGYIEGNVYGAGDQSLTYGAGIDNNGTITLAEKVSDGSTPKNNTKLATTVLLKEPENSHTYDDGFAIAIKGSVFGGGNAVENSNYATITSVFGSTKVNIIGKQQVKWDVSDSKWTLNDPDYKDSTGIFLQGGVYGDGHLCLVHGYREINIEYFHYNWHDFDQLKTFYSLQRSDVVNMVGSRVVLKGEKDLVDVNGTGTLYSINRVGTLNLKHNSTVKLSTIVNYLGGLTSDTQDGLGGSVSAKYITKGNNGKNENGEDKIFKNLISDNGGYIGHGGNYSDLYNYHVNNIWEVGNNYKNDYHNQYKAFRDANKNSASPTGITGAKFDSFNVVCVANGKYLEIRKEDGTYGPVEGLFTLELLKATPGEGGGFVYANIDSSTGDFICNTKYSIRDAYMDVEDNVGGYRSNGYTYYYWYILGENYNYQVELEGYIGSPVTTYPSNTSMFAYPEGYTYSLKIVEDSDSISDNPNSSQFNINKFTDHLNANGVIENDKYAIEIKAEYFDSSNNSHEVSLGFVSYDSENKQWGVKTERGFIKGFTEVSSNLTDEVITQNRLFEVTSNTKSLDIVYILHKGRDVVDELDEVPITVTMTGFEKESKTVEGNTVIEYLRSRVFTYSFDTKTSITLLVPNQEVNITYGQVYENFDGISSADAILNITKESAITAQFITGYRPVAYGQMQRVLTLRDSSKIYLYDKTNGLSITVKGTPESDGTYSIIYASDKKKNEYKVRKDNDNYYLENNSGVKTDLTYYGKDDASLDVLFPRNTRIVLASKILDFDTTYWYYAFEKAEAYVEMDKFKRIDNSSSIVQNFTLANACNNGEVEGVLIDDNYYLGVIENMIFIIDFSNVTKQDWEQINAQGNESDYGNMRLKLAHLYMPEGDSLPDNENLYGSNAIDIMNYVKKVKDANGDTYVRETPKKTNQFKISKTSDGINSFNLTIDNANTTINKIIGGINLEELRSSELVSNNIYNTHAYSDYSGKEYAVKLQLFKVDESDNVSETAEILSAGTVYRCNDREYEIKNDQNYINIPIGQTTSQTPSITKEFEIDLYKDLLARNTSGKFVIKATLCSSYDGEYIVETDMFERSDEETFAVESSLSYSLQIVNKDKTSIYLKGDDFNFTIKTNHTDSIVDDKVSYYLYQYTPSTTNQYTRIELSKILHKENETINDIIDSDSVTVNYSISTTAPKGTYRLAIYYHDRIEYRDFIVK